MWAPVILCSSGCVFFSPVRNVIWRVTERNWRFQHHHRQVTCLSETLTARKHQSSVMKVGLQCQNRSNEGFSQCKAAAGWYTGDTPCIHQHVILHRSHRSPVLWHYNTKARWDAVLKEGRGSYLGGFVELLLQPCYRHGRDTVILARRWGGK